MKFIFVMIHKYSIDSDSIDPTSKLKTTAVILWTLTNSCAIAITGRTIAYSL